MDRYQVVCTIHRLPKHQRRHILGVPVTTDILGHNPIRERSFYINSNELTMAWDQLQTLYSRGELEVRNPDGTLLRFYKPEVEDPPEDKIQKLPTYKPIIFSDPVELEDIEVIGPLKEEPGTKSKKKKARKKKDD